MPVPSYKPLRHPSSIEYLMHYRHLRFYSTFPDTKHEYDRLWVIHHPRPVPLHAYLKLLESVSWRGYVGVGIIPPFPANRRYTVFSDENDYLYAKLLV